MSNIKLITVLSYKSHLAPQGMKSAESWIIILNILNIYLDTSVIC